MNDVKMMSGSTTGKTYVLIARRGDVALGLKLEGVVPAAGTDKRLSYFACKLRSSPYGQDVEHEETEQTVVSMSDVKLTLKDAWPNIEFQKVDSTRCSCIVGFYVRGNLKAEPDKVLAAVLQTDYLKGLVDFLYDKAGPDHTVLRRGALVEWMQQQIQPQLDQVLAAKKALEEFSEQTEATLGVAGFEATQMATLLKNLNPPTVADAPAIIKKKGAAVEVEETEEAEEKEEGEE